MNLYCKLNLLVNPMTETDIQSSIMIALSQHGCKVFRRNTGLFYAKRGNDYTPVNIGVKGQSDLQGHTPQGGCFYIECKTPTEYAALMSRIERGKTTKHDNEQINFIKQMQKSGALAGFASSVEQALDICGIKGD